jgi:transposase
MSKPFWLTDAQMERLKPFFPRATASRESMTGGC